MKGCDKITQVPSFGSPSSSLGVQNKYIVVLLYFPFSLVEVKGAVAKPMHGDYLAYSAKKKKPCKRVKMCLDLLRHKGFIRRNWKTFSKNGVFTVCVCFNRPSQTC